MLADIFHHIACEPEKDPQDEAESEIVNYFKGKAYFIGFSLKER